MTAATFRCWTRCREVPKESLPVPNSGSNMSNNQNNNDRISQQQQISTMTAWSTAGVASLAVPHLAALRVPLEKVTTQHEDAAGQRPPPGSPNQGHSLPHERAFTASTSALRNALVTAVNVEEKSLPSGRRPQPAPIEICKCTQGKNVYFTTQNMKQN